MARQVIVPPVDPMEPEKERIEVEEWMKREHDYTVTYNELTHSWEIVAF